MKYIHVFSILTVALLFSGCASTDDSSATESGAEVEAAATAAPKTIESHGFLMDRYKSGDIPGYREEDESTQ